jgi:hypothetical protein
MHLLHINSPAFLCRQPGADAIFGNTLATLVNKDAPRKKTHEAALKPVDEMTGYSVDKPYYYDPYPEYNGQEWMASNKAEYVPCPGHNWVLSEDIQVFKGTPHEFPKPSFGSYDVLGLDANLCFERETRLAPYGFPHGKFTKMPADWDKVRWGHLQDKCLDKNKKRYTLKGTPNPYLNSVYGRDNSSTATDEELRGHGKTVKFDRRGKLPNLRTASDSQANDGGYVKEDRTAVLIRTYTGREYSDNDKQVIRSLISELALRTGGEYQVYLFVQVKDSSLDIWSSQETYDWVVKSSVPAEFVEMTILWNDEATFSTYTKLSSTAANVHSAQWLSVQKFMEEYTEFAYVWNWELDSRVTGHHYEFLDKLASFARKQPRRGLWERNERYYIPSVHGDYDTEFRNEVESRAVNGSVWGPPSLPFINPIGPKPPVASPKDDNFEWGVGEEADLITVAPIFNPVNSSWIISEDVWGYNDSDHRSKDLPRRATIITQSRVSRRLLHIMHVENLRGNHVASEMTTQTTALLHGLKAVYAPMPVFFDRPWSGLSLAKWFNGGWNGESGGVGSAMGWGREARFSGSTWYYRANPPQRMYNNWVGFEDTNIGGSDWEADHGRPCLPPMMLHPVKEVVETGPGHSSESRLPYS